MPGLAASASGMVGWGGFGWGQAVWARPAVFENPLFLKANTLVKKAGTILSSVSAILGAAKKSMVKA